MLFRYLKGYVCILVSGSQVSRFINLCANHHIEIWDISIEETGYSMKMGIQDFFLIKGMLKKTGSSLKIRQKRGFTFWLKKQAKRKLFLAGPFLCLFLLWFFSHFLWSIDVLGNRQITKDMLVDFLNEQGVHYGMSLTEIPLAEIKLKLRESYEEINWVSVSVKGTELEIRIKENDVWSEKREELPGLSLCSPVDGTITDVLVRQGVALVKRGDQVKTGDVLIEGKVPVLDENGEVKKIEYCQADGDVWILSEIPIKEELPLLYQRREYSGQERKKYYLEYGEEKWGIDIRKPPYLIYDIVEERENLHLFGDITLPLTLCTRTYREFTPVEARYSEQEAKQILEARLKKIITTLEEKGVQIIEKNVKIVPNGVSMSLQGSVKVLMVHNQQQLDKKEE